MNDQNNQNGIGNTVIPEQPTPENITQTEVPEMPALAIEPEMTPTLIEAPVAPAAPAPVEMPAVAPAMSEAPAAPVQPGVASAPAAPMQPIDQPKKTNGLCIAAIIFAFLPIPLLPLILAIAGLISAKKKSQKGKGLGIAAIILSALMPIVWAFAIIAIIGGSLFGIINGNSESAIALQKGCASLDEYGDYENGFVSCNNYTCEYNDGNFYFSTSCNLIQTNDKNIVDDPDVNDETDEDTEVVENEGIADDEETGAPSITLRYTNWLFDDNSEIVFSGTTFKWYKEKDVHTNNYYSGTYKFLMGAEAETYLTVDLSSYGLTLTELQGIYGRNEEYYKENLVVLVLETTEAYIDSADAPLTDTKTTMYYGFALSDTELDIADMDDGEYGTLSKIIE